MAISIALQKSLIISFFILFFIFPSSLSNRCPSHESQALLRIKLSCLEQHQLSSWVNGRDCCTNWTGTGISCDNRTNHVVSIKVYCVISENLCQLLFLTSFTIEGASGTTIPPYLGNLSYMQSLVLSDNSLSGMIPPSLCFLTRLTLLYLEANKLNGHIPPCLGNLLTLNTLSLYTNQIIGSIPTSIGSLFLLQNLDLGYNQLSGTIPSSFSQLSSLSSLYADGNQFNETVSSASLPPSLVLLYLSLNHYQSISGTFFHNLTSLNHLYLSDCVLNISTTWIPPFSLSDLYLVSCVTESEFPAWISTQFSLKRLGLTNASLVGVIPSWLWETSPLLVQ